MPTDDDEDEVIIIRRPKAMSRVRTGLATVGNWLASCWRRVFG